MADTTTQSPLDQVKSLVSHDLNAVEALIRSTSSHIPLANAIIEHVIQAGGKRLRPIALLLWAKHFEYQGKHQIDVAAGLELVHTATLLHDDVVDESPLRRGRPTASALWGNAASVLSGDYIYAQSFALLTQCFHPQLSHAVSLATMKLAEGELLQLTARHNLELDEATYIHILSCKTGQLFQLASVMPGYLTHQNETILAHLGEYGMNLGLAFQLMDDVLDYTGEAEMLGKRVGDDLADGNLTLPLIYALQHANGAGKKLIQETLQKGDVEAITDVQHVIEACGAIAYTQSCVQHYTEKALSVLKHFEASVYLNGLKELATFNMERSF